MKGGAVCAAKMTPERRAEIAKKAASTRWKNSENRSLPLGGDDGFMREREEGPPKLRVVLNVVSRRFKSRRGDAETSAK